jgi:formylglycine-generating enzyme required for sulfatase activity
MPPEQATGAIRDIGPASDVYSVGATLYFLLTGRPPFQTASTAETIRQVIEAEPVPVRRLNPPVHRDLETICLKCLRKEPAKRYISAGDLAADLGRFLAGEPILARRIGVGERAVKWAKRRPAVAAMIGVTVVAILGSGIAVKLTQIDAAVRQAETEATAAREQAKTAVEALYAAPAIAVPYTLANLAPLKEFAIPLLRQAIDDSKADTVQRLHAAYALADLDEAPQDFLLADVATAPDAECRNLVIALEHIKALALPKLARRAQSAAENTDQARYAIVALHLGDPQPAKDALLLRDDPIHRTTLIHAYAAWHGNLSTAAELVRTSDDSAFRSGLCVAFGRISPDTLEQVERDMVAKALTACYTDAPDGGTHSAAGWALRQWKREPPAIAPASRPPSHRRWFVNGQGMTMVEVAPGKFTMDTPGEATPGWFLAQEVTLTKPFYLCDREVTIEQFQRFINDADYPAAEKPQAWKGAEQRNSPTLECPVQQVNWFDAVVYCNWLSMREGRKLCYERTGEKAMVRDNQNSERECEVWRCDFTADGYRLPTEAEWEYASRAGSAGAFCFGSDEDLLPQYAWFIVNAKSRTWPGAMKKPSAFGLFDMQGNVWEWCWDWCGSYSADPVSDPTGPVSQFSGSGRVLRGGAFNDYASSCHSGARYSFGHPAHRYYHFSFRVSCGR